VGAACCSDPLWCYLALGGLAVPTWQLQQRSLWALRRLCMALGPGCKVPSAGGTLYVAGRNGAYRSRVYSKHCFCVSSSAIWHLRCCFRFEYVLTIPARDC